MTHFAKALVLLLLLGVTTPVYAAVQITDGTDNANVDAAGNLNVVLPATGATAGYAKVADGDGDDIEIFARDSTNTLLVGSPFPVFYDPIESTSIDLRKWTQPVSTMTMAQATGAITLNSGNSVTSGQAARITTWQQFPYYATVGCGAYWTFRFSAASLPLNQVTEMGMAVHTGTTAATDGVYFQTTTAGTFQAVRTFNSFDTSVAVTLANPTSTHAARIVRGLTSVAFQLDGVTVATIPTTGSTANALNATQVLPFSARIFNNGTASLANQLIMGPVTVFCDTDQTMDYGTRMARMGSQLHVAPANNAPARTGVQNPNWANSAAPAAAGLSNTAASYTTLGGQYQFAALATNETDWALFAWQNSVSNTAYITSITADLCVTGTAAVNATNFFWAAATGATAVTLAGTDTIGTGVSGPRRLPLFSMGHVAAAAQGTCIPTQTRSFDPPLVVDPSRFFHIILKSLNQAATASLVYRGTVGVHGYTGP